MGGGGGSIASTKATAGNNTFTASVGGGNGPLVNSQTSGNPLGGGLTSGTSVNLGGLFGGGGGGGGNWMSNGVAPGGGGGGGKGGGGGNGGGRVIVPANVQAAIGDMSSGEVAAMKRHCNNILAMPTGYDDSLIQLCRVLRRL